MPSSGPYFAPEAISQSQKPRLATPTSSRDGSSRQSGRGIGSDRERDAVFFSPAAGEASPQQQQPQAEPYRQSDATAAAAVVGSGPYGGRRGAATDGAAAAEDADSAATRAAPSSAADAYAAAQAPSTSAVSGPSSAQIAAAPPSLASPESHRNSSAGFGGGESEHDRYHAELSTRSEQLSGSSYTHSNASGHISSAGGSSHSSNAGGMPMLAVGTSAAGGDSGMWQGLAASGSTIGSADSSAVSGAAGSRSPAFSPAQTLRSLASGLSLGAMPGDRATTNASADSAAATSSSAAGNPASAGSAAAPSAVSSAADLRLPQAQAAAQSATSASAPHTPAAQMAPLPASPISTGVASGKPSNASAVPRYSPGPASGLGFRGFGEDLQGSDRQNGADADANARAVDGHDDDDDDEAAYAAFHARGGDASGADGSDFAAAVADAGLDKAGSASRPTRGAKGPHASPDASHTPQVRKPHAPAGETLTTSDAAVEAMPRETTVSGADTAHAGLPGASGGYFDGSAADAESGPSSAAGSGSHGGSDRHMQVWSAFFAKAAQARRADEQSGSGGFAAAVASGARHAEAVQAAADHGLDAASSTAPRTIANHGPVEVAHQDEHLEDGDDEAWGLGPASGLPLDSASAAIDASNGAPATAAGLAGHGGFAVGSIPGARAAPAPVGGVDLDGSSGAFVVPALSRGTRASSSGTVTGTGIGSLGSPGAGSGIGPLGRSPGSNSILSTSLSPGGTDLQFEKDLPFEGAHLLDGVPTPASVTATFFSGPAATSAAAGAAGSAPGLAASVSPVGASQGVSEAAGASGTLGGPHASSFALHAAAAAAAAASAGQAGGVAAAAASQGRAHLHQQQLQQQRRLLQQRPAMDDSATDTSGLLSASATSALLGGGNGRDSRGGVLDEERRPVSAVSPASLDVSTTSDGLASPGSHALARNTGDAQPVLFRSPGHPPLSAGSGASGAGASAGIAARVSSGGVLRSARQSSSGAASVVSSGGGSAGGELDGEGILDRI